jgi:hypothetical protein
VREEVVDRDRLLVVGHALEVVRDRIVDRELAAGLERQDRGGRELLRDRTQREDAGGRDRHAGLAVGQAVPLAEDGAPVLDDEDGARDPERLEPGQVGVGPTRRLAVDDLSGVLSSERGGEEGGEEATGGEGARTHHRKSPVQVGRRTSRR